MNHLFEINEKCSYQHRKCTVLQKLDSTIEAYLIQFEEDGKYLLCKGESLQKSYFDLSEMDKLKLDIKTLTLNIDRLELMILKLKKLITK